jgi:MATE family multidrug resistance protein
MHDSEIETNLEPLGACLKRHAAELVRLAGPSIVARAGVLIMALVDTIMVGRFSTRELAFLGIGLAPVVPLLLAMMGMVMGTLVASASAFGSERFSDCGAAWRRSLPLAIGMGICGAAICGVGTPLLRGLGQSAELAGGGGPVLQAVGLGLPAALVFLTTIFFLEGIKRPIPGMLMMIAANVLNVFLNWLLIYGNWGFPVLGALGSAWATTFVRFFLAAGIVIYVWSMSGHARFGVRTRAVGGWRAWTRQRQIGYAAGASIGVEAVAFGAINIFAGWLGPVPLAGYSIAINLLAMVFMVAIGLGSATAVRVGIAHGRGDYRDLAIAGWTGLAVNTIAMAAFGALFAVFSRAIVGAYSTDPAVIALTSPVVAFCAWVLVADGGQGVMANALRGRGETWFPSALHVFSYIVVMIPISWLLAFSAERAVMGLFEGVLIASIVSFGLLAGRFFWLSADDKIRNRQFSADTRLG